MPVVKARAVSNEQEARLQAKTGVVQSILSVLDHFDLALAQDSSKATAEQILSGIKVIRDDGGPNLMIYKPAIKYMFKEGENGRR